MDTYKVVIELTKIAAPVVVTILAFFLGRYSRFDTKREIASQKRMDEYYRPIMQRYMISFLWETSYGQSALELGTQGTLFFEMIVNNSHLADKRTQAIIPEFYMAFLNVLEYRDENPEYDASCVTELDVAFSEVIDSVYKEYKTLCKRLGYPEPLELRPPLVYEHKS